MADEKLYVTLFILRKRVENIQFILEIMKDNKFDHIHSRELDHKQGIHYTTLFFTVLMETVSFIIEYEEHFHNVEPEYVLRVKKVKKLTKPIISKIKEWTDLKNVRNELHAHGWREKYTKKFVLPKLHRYNTPNNFQELNLLKKYLTMVLTIIHYEFIFEYDHCVLPYITGIKEVLKITPMTQKEMDDSIFKLVVKVNKLSHELDFPYDLDFAHIISDH